MSTDITTQLLFHGGKRDGERLKLKPGMQIRFLLTERMLYVYYKSTGGKYVPARFGHHMYGDIKLIMSETEIYAFMTLLAALTGRSFREIKNHNVPDAVIYQVVS